MPKFLNFVDLEDRQNVAMIDYIYSYGQSKAEGSSTDVCV